MKKFSWHFGGVVLSLIVLLVSFQEASAYHFEIVSIDGTVTVNPNFLYPGTSLDFAYGPVSLDQVDEAGDREVSSNLFVNANICEFEASSILNMDAGPDLIQSLAFIQAQFFLRVVADPGDIHFGTLTAAWTSSAHSESHNQSSSELCYSEGYVGAVIRKNDLTALDMGTSSTSGGTADLGLVQDGTIISFGRFSTTGEFKTASISATAFAIGMECAATATASHSLTLVLNTTTNPFDSDIDISCEFSDIPGMSNNYTYVLRNNSSAPVSLTRFYLGTMDFNSENYSDWVAPSGFTATVANWPTLLPLYGVNIMSTSGSWEPYGTILTGSIEEATGGILWQGNIILDAGETATFGFSNPLLPFNMEWFAEHPDETESSRGYLGFEVAGPLGTYSNGYVLAPGQAPIAVEEASWGKIKSLNK